MSLDLAILIPGVSARLTVWAGPTLHGGNVHIWKYTWGSFDLVNCFVLLHENSLSRTNILVFKRIKEILIHRCRTALQLVMRNRMQFNFSLMKAVRRVMLKIKNFITAEFINMLLDVWVYEIHINRDWYDISINIWLRKITIQES